MRTTLLLLAVIVGCAFAQVINFPPEIPYVNAKLTGYVMDYENNQKTNLTGIVKNLVTSDGTIYTYWEETTNSASGTSTQNFIVTNAAESDQWTVVVTNGSPTGCTKTSVQNNSTGFPTCFAWTTTNPYNQTCETAVPGTNLVFVTATFVDVQGSTFQYSATTSLLGTPLYLLEAVLTNGDEPSPSDFNRPSICEQFKEGIPKKRFGSFF